MNTDHMDTDGINTYIITDYTLQQDLTIENGGLVQVVNSEGNVTISISGTYDRFHKYIYCGRDDYYWHSDNYKKNGLTNHFRLKWYNLQINERLSYGMLKDKNTDPKTTSFIIYLRDSSPNPVLTVEDIREVLNRPITNPHIRTPITLEKTYGLDLSVRYCHSIFDYSTLIQKQFDNILAVLSYVDAITCIDNSSHPLCTVRRFSRVEEGKGIIQYLRVSRYGDYSPSVVPIGYVWMEGDNVIDNEDAINYLTGMTHQVRLMNGNLLGSQRSDPIHYSNITYTVDYPLPRLLTLTAEGRETISRCDPDDEIKRLLTNYLTVGLSEEAMKVFNECCSVTVKIESLPDDLKEKYQQMIVQRDYLREQFSLLTDSSVEEVMGTRDEVNIRIVR